MPLPRVFRRVSAATTLIAASIAGANAQEPPKYRIVKLVDHASVGAVSSVAYDINNSLQAVGSYSTGSQSLPFSWSNGVMTTLSLAPGDVGGAAHGINNLGWIVGYTYTATGFSRPTMWRDNQRIDFSQTEPGLFTSGGAIYAINDKGVIAVTLESAGGFSLTYDLANRDIWLLVDRNARMFQPRAINSQGWVVGVGGSNAALLARNFTVNVLPSTASFPPAGSWANDINDSGVVVGHQVGSSTYCPTKWENGVEQVFFCSGEGAAYGINNRGAIVGQFSRQEGGFLRLGNRTHILSTLIDPADPLRATVLPVLGQEINESMAIVGVGRDEVGATFAMALIPVPEPSTYALMVVGVTALLGFTRRRRLPVCQ
jgi:uncharacterized membrane protein